MKQWDYRYGGNDDDRLTCLIKTRDGGFMLGGYSASGSSGDKSQFSWGLFDYWIVKLDSLGIKQWDKRFGGTEGEIFSTVQHTKDGGYILGGSSSSGISGNKTEPSWGATDYWIVKIDSVGVKQWDKRFGGTNVEGLASVEQTSDGGYILGGLSSSGIGGDKTDSSWGGSDYWIVKTDSLGVKQWDKRFGGSGDEQLMSLKQTTDRGYILGGHSTSGVSGDKSQASWGNWDYWIVKIDSIGIKQWDQRFGGTDGDYFFSLKQTVDGGYILGGYSDSGISGDKTQPSWGGGDYWIVKIDSLGVKQWDERFGGTANEDELGNITLTTDGGYLIPGPSYSPISGDKTENNLGLEQSWFVKTDSLGTKQWDKTISTTGHDEYSYAVQAKDGCFVFANQTQAGVGGDKTQGSWGGYDYWVIKYCDTTGLYQHLPQSAFNSSAISGCPGSCFDFTNASLNATSYQWFFSGGNPASSTLQNPSNICYANPGVYDVMLIASSNFASDTLVQASYITIFTPLAVSISQNGNFLTCNPASTSYQWSLNGYQIPGATSQTLFINQTGTFTIVVVDSNGCNSSDTFVVNNIPSPDFSTPDTTLCEKFCTNFFDQSTNNPTVWLWIFPGGDPAFSSDQNPVNICYNVPGVYDVTLITTNANGNDTLTLYNYITVNPTPPIPTITQVGYTLTSSPASSYQWQLNAVDIPGATNQSYTILQTGYYTVVVGDSNSCKNSATVYVLISGVENVFGEENFSVEPNPSGGIFIIRWLNGPDLFGMPDVIIEVSDAIGQIIFSSEETNMSQNFSKTVDLSEFASGVYFLRIKTEGRLMNHKIVIGK
ncbi:MAG TPA: T9SS type A sorting domain-containing protein [Chitinophagales bacterium]|nr:T9SS type A sorting domain-containing protein [Chitinophagales bacterium]